MYNMNGVDRLRFERSSVRMNWMILDGREVKSRALWKKVIGEAQLHESRGEGHRRQQIVLNHSISASRSSAPAMYKAGQSCTSLAEPEGGYDAFTCQPGAKPVILVICRVHVVPTRVQSDLSGSSFHLSVTRLGRVWVEFPLGWHLVLSLEAGSENTQLFAWC